MVYLFSTGLLKAKKEVTEKCRIWTVSHIITSSGAVLMSVTESRKQPTSKSPTPTACFNVTFVPCIDWVKVPDGLLTLPTSPCDPFPRIKHSLQKMANKSVRRDRCPIILEARNPSDADSQPQWKMSLMKYDRAMLKLLNNPSLPFHTKDILVLVESMVLSGSVPLSALTKQVLLQALLNTMFKFQHDSSSRSLLFLCLLEYIQRCCTGCYLKMFLVPSVSVLRDTENYEMERTVTGLVKIIKDITQNPEMLLLHMGLCTKLETLGTLTKH